MKLLATLFLALAAQEDTLITDVTVIDVSSNSVVANVSAGSIIRGIAVAPITIPQVGSCPTADLLHWWPADGNSPNDVIGDAHLTSIGGAGFTTGYSAEGFDLSGGSDPALNRRILGLE